MPTLDFLFYITFNGLQSLESFYARAVCLITERCLAKLSELLIYKTLQNLYLFQTKGKHISMLTSSVQ